VIITPLHCYKAWLFTYNLVVKSLEFQKHIYHNYNNVENICERLWVFLYHDLFESLSNNWMHHESLANYENFLSYTCFGNYCNNTVGFRPIHVSSYCKVIRFNIVVSFMF